MADLVLTHGNVVTLEEDMPRAEAIAIRGDRILAVGSNAEVSRYIGPKTRTIRLNGRTAMPGFIEGHGHFVSLGESKMLLDLSSARTWEEVVDLVADAARKTPPGRWIVGRGWHQGKWVRAPRDHVEGYPVHHELSRRTPDHPVLLTHGTGHMVLANAAAMAIAGVQGEIASNAGGEVLRDAAGKPTGVFRENAAAPLHRAYDRNQQQRTDAQRQQDLLAAIELATAECLSHGVTTLHDAGTSFATIDTYRELAERDALKVRLWVMLSESNEALARRMDAYRFIGAGNHHLTVRAVKRLIDGALGTHGAWLLEPYQDLPASTGHNTTPPESIRRTANLALEHGFQLCVHAIGDRANRVVLHLMAEALRGRPKADLRWRIEHAQHLHPHDIPRFAQLGVIASMQGVHCTSDGPFVVARLGERRAREGAYAWRSLLDHRAIVINGTDTPVERIDPIACFYSSVTRRLSSGAAFFPEQCMSRLEALRSYTRDAAYAGFEEDIKGTLKAGKLADIVILSQDLLTVAEGEILSTKVLGTLVGGKLLYESDAGVRF